jgi:23S rRNA (uracil1939-C5)-methyltransferase
MPGADEIASVAALTHEGEGVVRVGKTAFVAGALPGETVRFRRTRTHRHHDDAQLLEVIEASAARVTPKCRHFGTCGGCALQHLSPQAQLEAKHAELRDNFERLARVTPQEWLEPLRGPVWAYRRRARLGAKYVIKKGRVVVGFRERLAPYVAELERCEVLSSPVGAMIGPLASMLTGLSIRDRLPQIEVAVADNAVALVLRVLQPPTAEDKDRLLEFARAQGVRFYLQPKGLDSVRPLEEEAPLQPLVYRLPRFGLELEFAPTDFVQINAAINEALVSRALELLDLSADSSVLDLYCGLGNFTLPLAKVARTVVGVEGDRLLVERARHNARRNGIENAEFHVADLSQAVAPAMAPWMKGSFTHVLIDPPRAGAREILPAIAALGPRTVLYISCHPGSLARDVGILAHELGFVVRAAGVLDMFPHTGHVESVALLQGGKS